MKRIKIATWLLVILVVLFVTINVLSESVWVSYINYFLSSLVGSAVGYIIGTYVRIKRNKKIGAVNLAIVLVLCICIVAFTFVAKFVFIEFSLSYLFAVNGLGIIIIGIYLYKVTKSDEFDHEH